MLAHATFEVHMYCRLINATFEVHIYSYKCHLFPVGRVRFIGGWGSAKLGIGLRV